MGRLVGKVAIVTGGASGIGRATALQFAKEGARVAVADFNLEGAKEVVKEILAFGGTAIAVIVDAGSGQSIQDLIQTTKNHFGRIDILHNNVGMTVVNKDLNVVDIDVDVWDRVFEVNLKSVLIGCKYVIPVMLENGGGSIVNTASLAGLTGDVIRTAYGASKAGVINLTKYVATQFGKQNIRCNAVAPGLILTPAAKRGLTKEYIELFESHNLLPRLGKPEDIANTVTFLASDEASYITGQTIEVDGGNIVHNPTYADMGKLLKQ